MNMSIVKKLTEWEPDGCRMKGRPTIRRKKSLREDLKQLGVTV